MRLLIIDDSRSSLAILGHIVRQTASGEIELCSHPIEALRRCDEQQFDLVIVDHIMPEMDGIQFTTALRMRANYRSVPILVVTGTDKKEVRLEAVKAGANDFVTKPFDPVELQARVTNLMTLRKAQVELADKASWLVKEVRRATKHVLEREEEIIWRLARAIEYRDGDTGEHVSRVARISQIIAEGIGLDAQHSRTIYLAAPLHDIGKIGTPDAILGKPGRLTPDEITVMREHVTIGARILEKGSSDLIRTAELIALGHHERWDGTGYPNRVVGKDIPVEARIVAIADVFDALCSARPYKDAWPIEKAYDEILANSGTHFDPACVVAFKQRWDDIKAVMVGSASEDERLSA